MSTRECLEFILALPPTSEATLCAFYFNYDVTHILRDLPDERIEAILETKSVGSWSYGHWNGYQIDYVPGRKFQVARANPDETLIEGTSRTIWDCGRLHQKPFVQVLKRWKVCDAETLAEFEQKKAERDKFTEITPEILGSAASSPKS